MRCPWHCGYSRILTRPTRKRERTPSVPRALFASVVLHKGRKDGVGERELCKIFCRVILVLVYLEAVYSTTSIIILLERKEKPRTALAKGLDTFHLHDRRLVRQRRHKLVINKNNRIILDAALDDQIRNACRVCKRRDVPPDLVERETEVARDLAEELGFGFVADDDDGGVGVDFCWGGCFGEERLGVVGECLSGGFGDGGVDAAAETFVRGDDYEEFVGCGLVGGGVFKDLW